MADFIKRFAEWMSMKQQLHFSSTRRPLFNQREVWWCSLGENVGDETNGKNGHFVRPVLVIRKFNRNIFYGVPLSTKLKPKNKYYFEITFKRQTVSVLTSQMRLIDAKRLQDKMGKLDEKDFERTKKSIKMTI